MTTRDILDKQLAKIKHLKAMNQELLDALEGWCDWLDTRPAGLHPDAILQYRTSRQAIDTARREG